MPIIGYFPGGSSGSSFIVAATPSQDGELVYNGSEQSPTWKNYDEDQLTISGETSATNVGTYTVTFTPREGYYWSTGTAEGRDVTWTIAKAQSSVTVDKTEVELGKGYSLTATIEVTEFGDGEIVAESSNPDVVQVSVDGTTVTLNQIGNEDTTVTVTIYAKETENYTASDPVEVTIVCVAIPTLEDTSWNDIAAAADDGVASSYWAVGDRKAITLNGAVGSVIFSNDVYYAFILGFDHNAELEGYNTIHFQIGFTAAEGGRSIAFVDSMYGEYAGSSRTFRMNPSDGVSGKGGWGNSYMRLTVMPQFKAVFPSELQAIMKSVTKYSHYIEDDTSKIESTTDECFILDEYEYDSSSSSYISQYDFYAAGNSQAKYKHSATSERCAYWTRYQNESYHYRVKSDGEDFSSIHYTSIYSFGVAPAFVV